MLGILRSIYIHTHYYSEHAPLGELQLICILAFSRHTFERKFFSKSTYQNPRKALEKPVSIVVCWFQWTLKQLEREQIHRQTDIHDNYHNPHACAPRVNNTLADFFNFLSLTITEVYTRMHDMQHYTIHVYLTQSTEIVKSIQNILHTIGTCAKQSLIASERADLVVSTG